MAEQMAGYIRVSQRKGRTGPGYISPDEQRKAIERWAAYKGIHIASWHVDEDESGGTQERPALEEAIKSALSGEVGGIVAWKIDRFSRFTEGALGDLRRLQAAGARLAFVVEDIDTSGPMGKLIYTIMVAMAELFLENVKAGFIVAKARAIKRGAPINPTPFGYDRVQEGGMKGTLTPNNDALIVREAYRTAGEGSVYGAMAYLKDKAPGKSWSVSNVRRLLANRVYLGEIAYGDERNSRAHAAIVEPGEWYAAQTEVSGRRSARALYPLSGFAKCSGCGSPLIGTRRGEDKERAYLCSRYRKGCSSPVNVGAELLEGYCANRISHAIIKAGGFDAFVNGGAKVDLGEIEARIAAAEDELRAFAADQTMRRALGGAYTEQVQARVQTLDDAMAELLTARSSDVPPPTKLLDAGEGAQEVERFVLGSLSELTVVKGRGKLTPSRVRMTTRRGAVL